jgi:hypothetical protein
MLAALVIASIALIDTINCPLRSNRRGDPQYAEVLVKIPVSSFRPTCRSRKQAAQPIYDVPAECESRQTSKVTGFDDLVAREQSQLGPRREGAGEALPAPLLPRDERAQDRIVAIKGAFVEPSRRRQQRTV